jgi:hypothetical protein
MSKISLQRRPRPAIEHAARCAAVGLLLLLLAACAGNADTTDNGKSHGLYGGVTGGWSHP